MGEVHSRCFKPSLAVLAAAAFSASIAACYARLAFGPVLKSYLLAGAGSALFTMMCWTFFVLFRFSRQKVARPIPQVMKRLRVRLPFLLLPAIVSPVFLAAYTTGKAGVKILIGFHWDKTFTDIDHAIFGMDPWMITHALLSANATRALAFIYIMWGVVLVFVQAVVAQTARAKLISVFFPAMMATWLIGGVGCAYAFSSAGPALVHAVDPSLADRFAPLLAALRASLPADDPILLTQRYLVSSIDGPLVTKGGGISAMPSMHVATTMIFVLAARGTRWFWPAIAFALTIWFGSVHFGYHYATDGPAGALIAWGCWKGTEWALDGSASFWRPVLRRPIPESLKRGQPILNRPQSPTPQPAAANPPSPSEPFGNDEGRMRQ